MAKILCEKLEDALHPVDEDGIIAMRNVPEKSIVSVDFSVPRNVRMHRLWRLILKETFEAQKRPRLYPTEDILAAVIKKSIGYVIEVKDLHGNTFFIPDSTSFGRMDQIAFKQFFDAAINFIIKEIVPRVRKKDFEQRIFDLLKEPGPEQLER